MLISEGIYLSDQLGREVTAEEVRDSLLYGRGQRAGSYGVVVVFSVLSFVLNLITQRG